MKIDNTAFKDVKKNPDLRGDEFLAKVKHEFGSFGEWLDKIADDDGIGTYTLILYKDQYDPNNRGVQINIRQCVPDDIIDVVIQAVSHLIYDIAQEEQHKLYTLQQLKKAVASLEKKVLGEIGTGDLFKE